MKKSRIKKFIIALLIVTIVCISVLALVIGTDKTYSTYVSVIVPEGDDVKVYVGGKDVKIGRRQKLRGKRRFDRNRNGSKRGQTL